MVRLLGSAALLSVLIGSGVALTAERQVTLSVKNMYCATCPYTVKSSLQNVAGVTNVIVSFKDKTATVTYDDTKTGIEALTSATTNAGYPSSPKG